MTRCCPLLTIAAVAACKPEPAAPSVEVLGDPMGEWRTSESEAYARNLWDLQEFGGRLYLGYGDAVANSGPTPIVAYDPALETFTQDTVVNEEAVYSLRVFGERLYVAGPDAIESPDGALYVRDAEGWRTIELPGVIHANDVLVRGEEVCVAVQDQFNGGAVRCSRDDGATWSSYSTNGFRAVSLFQLGNALYVSSHDVGVRRIDGEAIPVKLELEGVPANADVLVVSPTTCGDELVFFATHVSYRSRPPEVQRFGLFHASAAASDVISGKRFPRSVVPAGLFEKGGQCYLVTNQARAGGGYDVTIERSSDGRTWHRAASFETDAMVRSAELMQGRFYLGTGCEHGSCDARAGRLLRVTVSAR